MRYFSLSLSSCPFYFFFFFQAEDGIRDYKVTGVQTCALPISSPPPPPPPARRSGSRAVGVERSPRSRAGNATRSPPSRRIASRSRTGVVSGRRRVASAPSGTRNLGPTPPTDVFVPDRSLKGIWKLVPVRTRLMNRLRERLWNANPRP